MIKPLPLHEQTITISEFVFWAVCLSSQIAKYYFEEN